MRQYVADHLVPLELCGPSGPQNIWAQLGPAPNASDKLANQLHAKVCRGELSLSEAQTQILQAK